MPTRSSRPSSVGEVPNRERGAHSTLWIVLVGHRRAEERHHRVADELLDRAAVPLELLPHTRVVRPEDRLDVLGVESLGTRREADEVAEEDRDDLAFTAAGRHQAVFTWCRSASQRSRKNVAPTER